RPAAVAVADGDIGRDAIQRHRLVGGVKAQVDIGVGVAQHAHPGHQPAHRYRRCGAERDRLAAGAGAQAFDRCADAVERGFQRLLQLAPWSVSSSLRGLRRNSATPRDSSSKRIWWLMAVAVTDSSSAACLALSWRAAASKARKAEREGRRRFAMAEFSSSVTGNFHRLSHIKPRPSLGLPLMTDEFVYRGDPP